MKINSAWHAVGLYIALVATLLLWSTKVMAEESWVGQEVRVLGQDGACEDEADLDEVIEKHLADGYKAAGKLFVMKGCHRVYGLIKITRKIRTLSLKWSQDTRLMTVYEFFYKDERKGPFFAMTNDIVLEKRPSRISRQENI